jgi:hypothetical protein
VKSPNRKIPQRPIFWPIRMLSFNKTGIGRSATRTSETIVTMAYPVNDGPAARQVPVFNGFQDLSTCNGGQSLILTNICAEHILQTGISYRMASKDERERAPKMCKEDEHNGEPYHDAI